MSKARKKAIDLERQGDFVIEHGAKGKTVDHIRLSRSDVRTLFVVVTFTDRTEWAVTLDSVSVAKVTVSVPDGEELGDMEPVAESRYIRLPDGYSPFQWDQIEIPKARKSRRRSK
jgi:hypothetical protein